MESVLGEIRSLVAEGVREINLISQDTTYYGMDLWPEKAGPRQPVDSSRGPTLTSLLREIQKIEGDFWVRLLYTHPAHWSDELIATIADCEKVARYIDIPLQHIDETMLAKNAPGNFPGAYRTFNRQAARWYSEPGNPNDIYRGVPR